MSDLFKMQYSSLGKPNVRYLTRVLALSNATHLPMHCLTSDLLIEGFVLTIATFQKLQHRCQRTKWQSNSAKIEGNWWKVANRSKNGDNVTNGLTLSWKCWKMCKFDESGLRQKKLVVIWLRWQMRWRQISKLSKNIKKKLAPPWWWYD